MAVQSHESYIQRETSITGELCLEAALQTTPRGFFADQFEARDNAICMSYFVYNNTFPIRAGVTTTLTLMELDLKYGAKLMENYTRSCLGQVTIFLARFFSVLDYSLF